VAGNGRTPPVSEGPAAGSTEQRRTLRVDTSSVPSGRVNGSSGHRYVLISVNNDITPITATFAEPLEHDTRIGVFQGERQVGVLTVVSFNAERTKAWISGDVAALQQGCTLKPL